MTCRNYYNEKDPKAAAWLKQLIVDGHVPKGEVDERDIADVRGSDLAGFVQCHFFAGIGGWSYALKLAGWPEDRPIWTGSCPCQPFSCAGKGKGEADPRHVWPHFRRLIGERAPSTVFGEQVASALGRLWLSRVRADLEAYGYAVGAADLCAAGVGAPHIRPRLYWMANASREQEHAATASGLHAELSRGRVTGGMALTGREQPRGGVFRPDESAEANEKRASNQFGGPGDSRRLENSASDGSAAGLLESSPRQEGDTGESIDAGRGSDFWSAFELLHCKDGKTRRVEPGTFPLADGFPARVDLLRGYGNAIVPQLAAEFIQAATEALEAAQGDKGGKSDPSVQPAQS